MMINKRLIGIVKESKKYIVGNVVSQWGSLIANIIMMAAIAKMFQSLYEGKNVEKQIMITATVVLGAIVGLIFFLAIHIFVFHKKLYNKN